MVTTLRIPRTIYPFEGRRFDRGGGIRMHWLDEGPTTGEPVVMVHGNPTWSIYYRGLVVALRDRHRCIVPDHVGMGLSDKPGDRDYTYTLASRIDDLERLLAHAGVTRDVTLVVHDWGGAIGMGWAVRHPERVKRLVILNTGAFHLPRAKSFPAALSLTRTPLGAALVRGANAFARTAARVCVTKEAMSRDLRRAYVAPYDDWDARIATLRFVEDIPLAPSDRAYPEITRIEEGLAAFRATPALICWGMKDFVFDRHFLAEWERRLPDADVHRFERAGHYVLEDEGDAISQLVRRFLDAHPIAGAARAVI
jgi:pimeloyl-ACP methyl ester carboxylesterase